MSRRRKGEKVDGWLIVDKPVGVTSTEVVNRTRRVFNARKAGHGGTLDPLATGILPIAFGEATKTVSYVMDGRKSYSFTLKWGEERDTDDAEGEVSQTSDRRPSRAEIEAALPAFVGVIEQTPPVYSAIKVDGQRAYDLARDGEPPELKSREVEILSFTLGELPDADHASFEVSCGKGAYIRALARDLGRRLGCFAHVVALRRTAVGPFTLDDAISLESVEALSDGPAARERLLPVETALDDIPALALTENEATRLRNGQALSMLARVNADRIEGLEHGGLVCAMSAGKPVAITRLEAGELRPVRVLNL